jgi:hypothetical protein
VIACKAYRMHITKCSPSRPLGRCYSFLPALTPSIDGYPTPSQRQIDPSSTTSWILSRPSRAPLALTALASKRLSCHIIRAKKLDWGPQLARFSDPFDPIEALRHSAAYLRELQNRFGNLGLAAAAYNVGPTRVSAWLTSHRPLPSETRNYLALVTG